MKLKNELLFNRAFSESLNKLMATELPISVSWKLGKLFSEILEKNKLFNKEKNKIINKYGKEIETKDKDGKVVKSPKTITRDNKEGWDKLTELAEIEEEYTDTGIKISDLGDVKLSPKDLFNLKDIITE